MNKVEIEQLKQKYNHLEDSYDRLLLELRKKEEQIDNLETELANIKLVADECLLILKEKIDGPH